MSPEQLEGKEADARADLFAFGAVLYEMLTGRKAFEGESQASLISAIMSTEPPPISELQAVSPPALDRIVKKCLAKDPEDRRHSAHDLEDDLRWIVSSDSGTPTAPARPSAAMPYALALAALALGAIALMRNGGTADSYSYHLNIDLADDIELIHRGLSLAVSPDGSTLLYSGRRDGVTQLWERELTAFESRAIPGTEGARKAFYSPDGE